MLYISLHRYDNGTFFPIHADSDYVDVGEGPGVGFNINIPWSNAQMGDREYMAAFAKVCHFKRVNRINLVLVNRVYNSMK